MTKREQIEKFLVKGVRDQIIAERVGCKTTYVRAVRFRMKYPERDRQGQRDRRERIYADPERYEAHLARHRSYWHTAKVKRILSTP